MGHGIHPGRIFKRCLDAALLLALFAQGFLAACLLAYGSIPLPADWITRRINQGVEGYRIEADAFRLTLRGRLIVRDVRVFENSIRDPLMEAGAAVIELDRPDGRSWLPRIRDVVVSKGALYLPAMHSPDGIRTRLLERIAFRFIPGENSYAVENFAALHEGIRLRGSVEWPRPAEAPDADELPLKDASDLDRFYGFVARGLEEKSRFDSLVRPTLHFRAGPAPDGGLDILAIVSSRRLDHPKVLGRDLLLKSAFLYEEGTLVNGGPTSFAAAELHDREDSIRAEDISGLLDDANWKRLLRGELPELSLAARSIDAFGVPLGAPLLDLDLSAYPTIAFQGTTSGLKGGVAVQGELDLQRRRGSLAADGSVDLRALLPEAIAEKLPPLTFSETPDYRLSLRFADGFELEQARLKAQVNDLAVKDLRFDHLRADLAYRNGLVEARNIRVEREDDWVDLGYRLDRSSNDYALTIRGSADPTAYAPILPRWWGGIFADFDFRDARGGYGDFIIQGNSGAPVPDHFFGSAEARDVRFRGVLLESGSLVVRGRERYAEVHDLDARSADGRVRGDIRFTSFADDVPGPASVRLDLEAELPLENAAQLFGGDIAGILADFQSERPPAARLEAAIFNDAYPRFSGKSYFDLSADSRGPIRYQSVPFDHLRLDIQGRGPQIHLRDLHFGYADGDGRALADLRIDQDRTPHLRFKLSLEDADQARAIRDLPLPDHVEGQLNTDDGTDPPQPAREETRLSLNLHAEGPLDDPYQYDGFGDFTLRGERLGNIDLLGPFSRALARFRINFTSFSLDEMRGVFAIREDRIDFSKLQLNGPRTRVDGRGTLALPGQDLDMRVGVYLFANTTASQSAIRKLGSALNPIPNLLEFELTGTLDDQVWRSLYDPRKYIPDQLNPTGLIPEQLNPANLNPF
ncbi:MAG: AsmA-like C-terminal region-containing protein [Opitutales bacterium]